MADVHSVIQQIKDAAEGGKGAVDSTVEMLETFLDKVDEAFGGAEPPPEVKELLAGVRQHKREIAKAVEA